MAMLDDLDDISGIEQWYDFSDSTTVNTDSNDIILTVTDKSGGADTLNATTGQPQWGANVRTAPNGLTVAYFDGASNLRENTSSTTDFARPITFVCTFMIDDDSGSGTETYLFDGATNNQHNIQVANSDQSLTIFTEGGSAAAGSYASYGVVHTVVAIYGTGADSYVYVDGTAYPDNSGAYTVSGGNDFQRVRLGMAGTLLSGELNGWIGEFAIYNKALSSAEIDQVFEHQRVKWLTEQTPTGIAPYTPSVTGSSNTTPATASTTTLSSYSIPTNTKTLIVYASCDLAISTAATPSSVEWNNIAMDLHLAIDSSVANPPHGRPTYIYTLDVSAETGNSGDIVVDWGTSRADARLHVAAVRGWVQTSVSVGHYRDPNTQAAISGQSDYALALFYFMHDTDTATVSTSGDTQTLLGAEAAGTSSVSRLVSVSPTDGQLDIFTDVTTNDDTVSVITLFGPNKYGFQAAGGTSTSSGGIVDTDIMV